MLTSSPLDQDQNVAIGITLPLRRGTTGYFEQSFQTTDQLKSNIVNLLKTRRGERVMQPDLGSGLWALLFEPNTGNLEVAIEDEIVATMSKWLPHVNIVEFIIDRDVDNINEHRVEIQLSFTLNNDPSTLDTVTFRMEP